MKDAARKRLGLVDARSKTGVFSRGSNTYNGISKAPNPTGLNQSSAANRLLKMRRKMKGL